MRSALLLCGLVTAFFAVATQGQSPFNVAGSIGSDGTCRCRLNLAGFLGGVRGPVAARLDSQEVRLNRLNFRLQGLSDSINSKLDEAGNADHIARDLKNRVVALYDAKVGAHCDCHSFQCGNNVECVANILVCDGHSDCSDGADEEDCDIAAAAGSVWKGTLVYDECTRRRPQEITLVINSVSTIDYFPGRPTVTASFITETETEEEVHSSVLIMEGTYNPALRHVYFEPPEDDRLALVFQYDGSDRNRAFGYIEHESSLTKCGEFVFHRE